MSDKDLVMRRDVLARKRKYRVYDDCYCMEFAVSVKDINRISPVPHEMSAREYLETESRMCKHYGIPNTFELSGWTIDEAIEMVSKFAREHPERSNE